MNLMVGQGIKYFKYGHRNYSYGVILESSDKSIMFADVYSVRDSYCYDDPGANKENHKDNVRLKDCPPPFSYISDGQIGGSYVYANKSFYTIYNEEDCKIHNVQIIDGGKKISKKDMQTVRHHPWPTQAQKEYENVDVQKKLQKRRLPAVSDVLDDMEKNSGMEY